MMKPTLNYTLKCKTCGYETTLETDGTNRPWHCENDKCSAPELELWNFVLLGSGRDLSQRAVEEYLENWTPGDGLELLVYLDMTDCDLAYARKVQYDAVYRVDYKDYVVERFINGRDVDEDIRYYLYEEEIVSDFEEEHVVIGFGTYMLVFN